MTEVEVNGRTYRAPTRPTVVFTVDGGDPRYLDDALARGLMPCLSALLATGARSPRPWEHAVADQSEQPVDRDRRAPAVHGIAGQSLSGSRSGQEVQLTDPSFLRAPTIHAALHAHRRAVLAVTAKDKLRRLLGAGDVPSISAEDG